MSFFSFVKISVHAKSRTRNSNANQNEMTQSKSKEISAQKLCAGTVSGTTHKAGGLYSAASVGCAKACEAAGYSLRLQGVATHKRHYTVFSMFPRGDFRLFGG